MNLQHSILSLRVFFFFPPLESSPEAAPWMEKPRIFPGGLVSLDEKPCNSSRHLCFVRLFSFASLRLCTPGYSFSLELPGFIPPPPFFFRCWRCWHAWWRHQRNLEETYSKRRSFVKIFLFCFVPPPLVFSFSHFIRVYVFWIFGSLKSLDASRSFRVSFD